MGSLFLESRDGVIVCVCERGEEKSRRRKGKKKKEEEDEGGIWQQ